jgi:uncharacterized protein (DUF58 family)
VLAAAAAITLGLALTSATLLFAGQLALAMISLAYLAELPKARLVRSERLEFAWRLPPMATGVVTPGVPFKIRCRLRNLTTLSLRHTRLGVFTSPGLKLGLEQGSEVSVRPGEQLDFEIEAQARAAGRHFLHGLTLLMTDRLGLIQTHLYFPSTLSLSAVPRPAAGRRLPGRPLTGSPLDRAGRHFLSLHGSGTELKEIRQHRAGDPFRSIDWKATARTGRLMVRQMESEIQGTHYILIDASATMRPGKPGTRKLDYGVEAASAFARLALGRNDRVGLIAFDTRIVAHVQPGEGRTHWLRVTEQLIGLFDRVDEDLTDLTDVELVEAVAAHLRQQQGISLPRLRGATWPFDVNVMFEHIRQLLGKPSQADRELAGSEHMAELRRYCRARGLPIPYRGGSTFGEKGKGLAEALATIGRCRQSVHSLLLVSDLEGLHGWEQVERGLRLAGSRSRPMLVIVPFAPNFARPAAEPLNEQVRGLLELEERRRLERARRRLSRHGGRLIVAAPEDMPALLYARAAAWRR